MSVRVTVSRRILWVIAAVAIGLAPLVSSAAPTSRFPSTRTLDQLSCNVVELHPGYPGYRGLEAGLVGYAETACLSDLMTIDPAFSIETQDEGNRRAAVQLGIPGVETDWTWEAWMAIAAARGYTDICYSCSLLQTPMPIVEGVGKLGPDDPRIALSSWLSVPQFSTRYFQEIGVDNPGGFPEYMQDRWLRVIAFAIIAGVQSTNRELLEAAQKVTSDYYCLSGGDCLSFDGYKFACFFIDRGGYVEPTAGMNWIDRTYILTVALLGAETIGSSNLGNQLYPTAINQYLSGLQQNPQADPVLLARSAFTLC